MLTDLYDHCVNDCGFNLLSPQPHHEICDFIQRAVDPILKPPYSYRTKKYRLLMVPRDHFKTTIGAVGLATYAVQRHPNIRILLDAHTAKHSEESLDGIKSIVESEPWIAKHGDWRKHDETDAEAWRADAITVAQRTQIGLREPTISCTGVDQSKVGGHYNLIIPDDLADGKNTQSETLRAKTRRRLGEYIPLLDSGGLVMMYGTRWHMQDVYHTILTEDSKREKRGDPPRFEKLIRRIWDGEGRPYFPSRYGPEQIEQLRLDCTEDEFAKWYLNEPIDDKAHVFPPGYFRFFEGQFFVDSQGQPVAEVTPL